MSFLVHFFNGRSSRILSKLSLLLTTASSLLLLSSLIEPCHDGVDEFLQLLLFALELLSLCQLVLVQPVHGFIQSCCDSADLFTGQPALDLLLAKRRLHAEYVRLETVFGRYFVLLLFILSLVLLGIVDHPVNVLLGEPAFVIGDGDLVLFPAPFLNGIHIEDAIGINVECDLNLRLSSWSWRYSHQVKLSQAVGVPGHGPLPLIDLDGDCRLVVAVGGEGLRLFGRNGRVPLDEAGHDTTGCLYSQRERSHVQQKEVAHRLVLVAAEDGSLDGSTIGNSFIWIDCLVELLAVEEVLKQFLNLRDPGASSHKDNVIDGRLVQL